VNSRARPEKRAHFFYQFSHRKCDVIYEPNEFNADRFEIGERARLGRSPSRLAADTSGFLCVSAPLREKHGNLKNFPIAGAAGVTYK
jgi:hypothetical protein